MPNHTTDTDRALKEKIARGRRPKVDAAPTRGQFLGRYRIERTLGSGGMGEVYLGVDPTLGRKVAIKVISLPMTGPDAKRAAVKRFEIEAKAAAKINHPNVVTVYDFVVDLTGKHLLVMEYLDGRTLRQLTEGNKPLPPEQVVRIAVEVLRGLEVIHAAGMIHRDLKPHNLMLMPDGRMVILDFGLVKDTLRQNDLTQTGMAMGSPLHISPEQVMGHGKIDGRADLYALATVLFQLLTGRPPYDGTAPEVLHKQIAAPMPAIVSPRGPVPPGMIEIVRKAMSKKPEDRYASATEMRTALERLQASLKATVPSPRTMTAPKAPVLPKAALPALPRTVTPNSGAVKTMTFSQLMASSPTIKVPPAPAPRPHRPSTPPPPPPAAMRPRRTSAPPPVSVESLAPAKRRPRYVSFLKGFAAAAVFVGLAMLAWTVFNSRTLGGSDASSAQDAGAFQEIVAPAPRDAVLAPAAPRTADDGCRAYEENQNSLAIEILKPLKAGSLDARYLYCLCAAEHFLGHADKQKDCQLFLDHPKRDKDQAELVDFWVNGKSKVR
ncbi:MAG: serine/threonine-protein kinase [Patescibacteria group bacterium]|nr:MAG: serine/threonine-protein kinase [Patescibacteria group bacterium]